MIPAGKCLACVVVAASAAAQTPPPNYGFDFVEIGAPGNRRPTKAEAPGFYPPVVGQGFVPPGKVTYRYRMATTEVSVSQWFEFVEAYAPYWQGSKNDPAFTSIWISYSGGSYKIAPGAEQYSANMSWRNAARYVNWLHNGKQSGQWAFEDGAYDTSTFGTLPNGQFTDQLERSKGAKYWIPNLDEWTKAVYYDPDRYGPGQEGYWLHPDGGNEKLISGLPNLGGETNAGLPGLTAGEFNVGSYPWAASPWGMLDASGGRTEWTESPDDSISQRRTKGSATFHQNYEVYDRLDLFTATFPWTSTGGLRIASQIPSSPGSIALILLVGGLAVRRRRQWTASAERAVLSPSPSAVCRLPTSR